MDRISSSIIVLIALLAAACAPQEIPGSSDSPETAAVVQLERHYQRVIEYNCDRQVISDGIQTVKSPRKQIEIKPLNRQDLANLLTSQIRNVTTDSNGTISNHTTIMIDYAKAALTHHVQAGINRFHYDFTFNDGTKESGDRYLNVSYSEATLDGYREHFPAPESCLPQPTPTPAP